MSNTLWPQGLQPIKILCLWNSPVKNAGLGSQSLFEGTFLTQDPTWVACTAGNLLGFEVISSLDTFQIKLMLTSECKSLGLRFYFFLVSRIVIGIHDKYKSKKKKTAKNFFSFFRKDHICKSNIWKKSSCIQNSKGFLKSILHSYHQCQIIPILLPLHEHSAWSISILPFLLRASRVVSVVSISLMILMLCIFPYAYLPFIYFI